MKWDERALGLAPAAVTSSVSSVTVGGFVAG